jgi:hypothetical protein
VCFHKKRELGPNSARTAADLRIEAGDTIYIKCFDELGNQLCWESWELSKPERYIDDDGFDALDAAFDEHGPDFVHVTADVPPGLARAAGATKGQVADWWAWRRATLGAGDDGVGDPGRVAHAEQARHAAAAHAHAAEREVAARRARELLVEGEVVEIRPDAGAVWCALSPRVGRPGELFPPTGSFAVPGHGLLDTGNAGLTMISMQTATAAGIRADPRLPSIGICGINGFAQYPSATVHLRIRGVEFCMRVALGGTQGVLVGEDVLASMFERNYTVAGFYGQRAGGNGVQWVRHGA